MQRRIKVVMADRETYDKSFYNPEETNVHHILLSNCHRYPDWIEEAVHIAQKNGRDTIMIGVEE